jgi:hypothetical protein
MGELLTSFTNFLVHLDELLIKCKDNDKNLSDELYIESIISEISDYIQEISNFYVRFQNSTHIQLQDICEKLSVLDSYYESYNNKLNSFVRDAENLIEFN